MRDTSRLRQSHKKSRRGCRECKQRHTKCDEIHPTCGGCAITNRRCSFLDLNPVNRLPAQRTISAASSSSPHAVLTPSTELSVEAARAGPATSGGCEVDGNGDTEAGGGSGGQMHPDLSLESDLNLPRPCFDMRHLVLLHHLENEIFRVSGSVSWLGATSAVRPCADAIFQAAVSAPYLMHELLAFSALHLSILQSGDTRKADDYLRQAAELQTRGLALFNAVKPEVRNENCLALFIFAATLGMHALFDAVTSCTDYVDLLDKITGYLKVHRGVAAITYQSWPTLRHSEIHFIIDAIEAGDELYRQRRGDTANQCDKLLALLRESSDKLGPGPYQVCLEALEALHWAFGVRNTVAEGYPTHVTLAWPTRVSAEFVELIEQRQPVSLIILAHWAVLLQADRDFWVFGNAGRNIITHISTYLGSYWDDWLQLPRSILRDQEP